MYVPVTFYFFCHISLISSRSCFVSCPSNSRVSTLLPRLLLFLYKHFSCFSLITCSSLLILGIDSILRCIYISFLLSVCPLIYFFFFLICGHSSILFLPGSKGGGRGCSSIMSPCFSVENSSHHRNSLDSRRIFLCTWKLNPSVKMDPLCTGVSFELTFVTAPSASL